MVGSSNSRPFEIIAQHQHAAPVNVDNLARDLGIAIYRTHMESGVYAKLVRDDGYRGGPSGYSIYVNTQDAAVRQRFSIAHEIAHFVLHRDLMGSEIIDREMYRSDLGSVFETQANRLAAAILMPSELVRAEWRKLRDIGTMARRFDVSKAAMAIKLESLGLVSRGPSEPGDWASERGKPSLPRAANQGAIGGRREDAPL